MKAARFTGVVVLVACTGLSFFMLSVGAAMQHRFQEKHDRNVREIMQRRRDRAAREISQRPMRTGTYGKKEVHFGEMELASFSEWKSNGDFGGRGQQNDSSNQARQVALLDHLNSPGVREIAGTWGPSRVKHVVDPVTRRCVVLIERGQSFEFKRGLQLSNDQMERLLKTGKLP